MRVILTTACALAFSTSAFAAPSTPTPPTPPAQTIQKADQKPLRLREPMPKDGGGPEIG